MQDTVLSVSDAIALVNQTLEYAYPSVIVEGEIASFKLSKQKYIFFDLKDEMGVLGCFMMAYQLRVPLEDGMKVQVKAQPRLTTWGKFSLNIMAVQPVGAGSIKRSFELLKAKLEKEGLFEAGRKRMLPDMPTRVGLIASVESAGYKDFLKILDGRWGGVDVTVADVQVQGAEASKQVVRALRYFNEQADPVDVLVVVRGGGSAEDLAVFNEEPLVRAVAASRIPTVVGVGHEVDTSLADLAADVRAATPSNAAQLLVPDRDAVRQDVLHRQRHMASRLQHRVHAANVRAGMAAQHLLGRIGQVLVRERRRVEYAEQILRQLDPRVVLQRGYALVRDGQGKVVSGAKPGDRLTIETVHEIMDVGVENVRKK